MKRSILGWIVLMGIFLTGCFGPQEGGMSEKGTSTNSALAETRSSESRPFEPAAYPTFYIVSDNHHLSKRLYEDNATFQKFCDSGDGKLVQYSEEIFKAFMTQIEAERPQFLIVSGDLTTNGEKASHEELADWFSEIETHGTKVLVIPGNHDINNPYALSFLNNKRERIDSVTPEEFRAIYADFGYEEAISEDAASLSYLTKASDNLYVLMLDTCMYNENIELGFPVTGGRLKESTLAWIDGLKNEIPKGAKIISVSHHNMMVHAEILSQGFTLNDSEEAVEHLKKLGIHQNFSGHIHTQDVKITENGDFADIVTGSMIQYPQEYAVLNTSETGIWYETRPIAVRDYALKNGIEDAFLLNFDEASRRVFYEDSAQIASRIESGYTDEERAEMADVIGRLNLAYFAGEEPDVRDEILNSRGYALWKTVSEGFAGQYIETMLADETYGDRLEMDWQD